MHGVGLRRVGLLLGLLFCACSLALAQQPSQPNETGQIILAGHATAYRIRHLPVSSYPAIPAKITEQLNQRGCLIPQTYEAHAPENVIHASLQGPGSSDWAVLCSTQGTVTLLVFFATAPVQVLATAPETERLQSHDATGTLGFNWGIDPAPPLRVHEAQSGLDHRPALLDHDALADSAIDHRTIYHYYSKSAWTLLPMPD